MTAAGKPDLGELPDETYAALAQFRSSLRRFLAFSDNAARDHGLSPSQHQLMLAIRGYCGDGGPSIGFLADALSLRSHSVVELVDRCVAHDLLERSTDPKDRRRSIVVLTDVGHRKLSELSVLHRNEVTRFRSEMNAALEGLD